MNIEKIMILVVVASVNKSNQEWTWIKVVLLSLLFVFSLLYVNIMNQ